MVPKRRPPRPHSWSWLRSPRRQLAAMKPMTVTSAKSAMKMTSAVTFRLDMRISSDVRDLVVEASAVYDQGVMRDLTGLDAPAHAGDRAYSRAKKYTNPVMTEARMIHRN